MSRQLSIEIYPHHPRLKQLYRVWYDSKQLCVDIRLLINENVMLFRVGVALLAFFLFLLLYINWIGGVFIPRKATYWKRKNSGLCTNCGTIPIDFSFSSTCCLKCQAKQRQYIVRSLHIGDTRQCNYQERSLRQRKLYDQGRCTSCAKQPRVGWRCRECIMKRRKRGKTRYVKERVLLMTNAEYALNNRGLSL